jgi:hypothetical protein
MVSVDTPLETSFALIYIVWGFPSGFLYELLTSKKLAYKFSFSCRSNSPPLGLCISKLPLYALRSFQLRATISLASVAILKGISSKDHGIKVWKITMATSFVYFD